MKLAIQLSLEDSVIVISGLTWNPGYLRWIPACAGMTALNEYAADSVG